MRKLLHAARASLVLMLFLIGSLEVFGQTYCASATTYGCSNGATLNSFYTSGAYYNINNLGTDCGGTGVINYTAQFATAAPGMSVNVGGQVTKYGGGAKVWIDWNGDGDYDDTGELVYASTSTISTGSTFSGSFTVPAAATAGAKRLRVKVIEGSTSFGPCSASEGYGETEEYTFNVITGPACATTGVVSIAATGPATACAGTSVTINATVTSLATGITMQWQQRVPAGTGTWTNIAGATGAPLVDADGPATGNTDYRLIVTCTASGEGDTSNVVTVNQTPLTACYCIPVPNSGYGCSNYRIDDVITTGGVTNFSKLNSNCAGSTAYGNYTDSVVSQFQGGTFNYSVKSEYGYTGTTTGNAKIWIDWNQDGTFSTAEQIYSGAIVNGTPLTGTIEVPLTAVTGNTRMRVMVAQYATAIPSACAYPTYTYGETEDYTVQVLASPACADVTFQPMTIVGVENICSGTNPFTLTVSGATLATGVTRQWERRSPSGTGTWTVIAGATSPFLNVAGITAATDYRYTVTCTATGASAVSAIKTVGLSPFADCYCIPPPVDGYGCSIYRIDDVVTTGGVANISKLNSNCAGSSAYGNYTDSVVSQFQGGTVNYSIKSEYGYTGTTTGTCKIWVDWNQDGVFSTTTEQIYAGAITNGVPLTGTLEVPLTAVAGNTRMRVMVAQYTSAIPSPCSYPTYTYGETEDYRFTVLAAPACSGAGSIGPVTVSGPDSVCSGKAFTLVGGGPFASGITKLWERRPLGTTTWTTVTGATGSLLSLTAGITAATEFRYTVTCTASGTTSSRIDTVQLNVPTNCYCTPYVGYGCAYDYNINNVSTTGATVNISNLGTGCPTSSVGGYSNYRHLFATAFQGTVVNYNVGLSSSSLAARIWIDWNRDGDFTDAGELIYESSTMSGVYAPTTITGSFEVPLGSSPGATAMRISTWNAYTLSSTYTPCYTSDYTYGETEDYTFNIVQPPPCNTVPMTGVVIDGPDSVCASNAFIVTASSVPVASGVVRQWQSKPTSGTTWTTAAGVTTLNYNVAAGITVPTDFRFIITCTATGAADTSDVISITMKTPTNCYCDALFGQAYYDDLYSYNYRLKDVIIRGDFDTLKGLNTPWVYDGTSVSDWGGYTDRTGESATLGLADLTQTGTYTGRITVRYAYANLVTRAWIDYNDNGFFEASESIFASPSSAPMSSGAPAEFSFSVPATALPGQHRMRVRTVYNYASPSPTGSAGVDPCTTYSSYGQTADFKVLVKRLMPCDSVAFPDSAIAFATPPNVCGSGSVKLNLQTKMPLAAGITYQWKSSTTAAGPYTTNVGPALTALAGPALTVTGISSDIYYKCFVLCDGDPIVISDSVWVQSVSLPITLTTESGQTCGPGTVTLGGNTTDGSVFWYAEAAGGSPVWMGNEYITPYLTATDTFYATGGAFGSAEAEVGGGSSTSYYYNIGPFAPYGGGKVMQYMYTADELTAAGLMAGNITKLAFNVAALPGFTLGNYEVSMKQVTTAPPMTWQTTGFTTMFTSASYMPASTGWAPMTLSGSGFPWDGTSNIIIKVCFNAPSLTEVYPAAGAGTHKHNTRSGVSMGYMSYSLTSTTYCTTSGSSNTLRPNAMFTQQGCESARTPVIAYVRPVPAPVNIGADETICKDIFGGRTLDVGVLPETYTRLWSNGDTEQTTRITESGTYSIIVANEYGCEVYDTVTKVLLEIPDVDLGPDALLCEGGVLTLDAGDDGTDYIWNTGAATRFVDIYSAGQYNVLVENSDGCIAVDTIEVTVSGHMPSVASIITTNTGPFTFSFEPLLSAYVVAYEWDFGDGSPISESANPTHTYATDGSYTVTLTVHSTCGTQTYTTTTHILGLNSGNVDDKSINLYPNPAKDIAVIESKGNLKMISVTVTNVLGQVMYEGETTAANKHQLELSAYASGLYTVRIETDKGFIIRKFEIVK